VIIGTHRILSKDVEFKKLGLVVIDEEHRFGVRHKERLKQLRTNVDILTMTATPIPRTLHLALMGARDTSQINTPPVDRLPIITEIHAWSEELIRDAVLQEIDRNGQVFFLHNRVESIFGIKSLIERLTPGVRCAVAHGQMPGAQLEKIMIDFMNQHYDVLICTTIIESGIDIPNTNTLIVNRADKFGLAQLYQLRGRIGRSSRQAYAYLLTPPRMEMTGDARRRLATLAELTELGSGMKIALRDLEIRGAGNLLGAEQSGFINSVGFDLYTKLLEEAVQEVKGDQSTALKIAADDIHVDFDGSALIPGDYIEDGDLRYDFYRRIGSAENTEVIETISDELNDRFGDLPIQARNLIDLIRLKILGRKLHFSKIILHDSYLSAVLQLPDDPTLGQQIIGSIVAKADPEQVEFRMTKGVEMVFRYVKGDSLREALRFLQRLTR
jgi:transcription-repair coupling factor (superfamily II helicase)